MTKQKMQQHSHWQMSTRSCRPEKSWMQQRRMQPSACTWGDYVSPPEWSQGSETEQGWSWGCQDLHLDLGLPHPAWSHQTAVHNVTPGTLANALQLLRCWRQFSFSTFANSETNCISSKALSNTSSRAAHTWQHGCVNSEVRAMNADQCQRPLAVHHTSIGHWQSRLVFVTAAGRMFGQRSTG